MDIEYFGGNCVKITTKKATLIIDDTLEELGQKSIIKPQDIVLYTGITPHKKPTAQFIIDMPGELELVEAKKLCVQADMNLAKRQMTWFKRNPAIKWLDSPKQADQLVEEFLRKSSNSLLQ